MAITPYQPSADLYRPLLDDFLAGPWGGRMAGMDQLRAPHADVVETRDEIRVTLELSGVRLEDVEVSFENNILAISGEKKEERQENDQERKWHLSERRYGRFTRSFVLPRDVEAERISAAFENGVLTVTIPKSEKAKPRRIEIHNGGSSQTVGTNPSK